LIWHQCQATNAALENAKPQEGLFAGEQPANADETVAENRCAGSASFHPLNIERSFFGFRSWVCCYFAESGAPAD